MPAFGLRMKLFCIETVVLAKSSQTARKTGTDGIKLPLAVVTIQLANNHCGFDGEILTQIVANDFLAGIVVHHAAVGIGYLAEVLTALFCVKNSYGYSDPLDVCRNFGEINKDLLIVTLAIAGRLSPMCLTAPDGCSRLL